MGNDLIFFKGKEYINLPLNDIVFIDGTGNYICVMTKYEISYEHIRGTIKDVLQELQNHGRFGKDCFLRIKGNTIINTKYLVGVNPYGDKGSNYKPFVTLRYGNNTIRKETSKSSIGKLHIQKRPKMQVPSSNSSKLNMPVSNLYQKHYMHCSHEYIDLGLPSGTLWAIQNIGSRKPESYGVLYRHNDISTAESYNICEYSIEPSAYMQFLIDNYSQTDDIASNMWRGKWRMPTVSELQELISKCDWKWVESMHSIQGAMVTGPNGNKIFIPADSEDDSVNYWAIDAIGDKACCLHLHQDDEECVCTLVKRPIDEECCIRPVLSKLQIS